ncbi:MAG TPA: siderophore-interacting protein [Pseudonocardia sp.]|nr:siderophore-interacting protein [Pseudonocardia sp.]
MSRERHLERIAEVRAGTRAERVPYPIHIRECEVVGTGMVGSGLLRLTLGGDGTAGFESHAPCEHVKLVFPDERGELRLPVPDGLVLRWPRPMPVSREYTVRRYDAATGEIDLDIALHQGGLAAEWAANATPGTRVHVAGPPGGVVVPAHYENYLLGGDITALPAIARRLEELPRTAAGWAFIEVADASEEIELSAPEDVAVRWLHRGVAAPGTSDVLERAVRTVQVPPGERVFVWLAGEAGVLKPLRRWVRDELGVPREDCDITGYWKRGIADFDEEHEDEVGGAA